MLYKDWEIDVKTAKNSGNSVALNNNKPMATLKYKMLDFCTADSTVVVKPSTHMTHNTVLSSAS